MTQQTATIRRPVPDRPVPDDAPVPAVKGLPATESSDMTDLIKITDRGLYCEPGGFYVDPWQSVDRAVITHAHSDHARWGCRNYLATRPGEPILRMRLGDDADYQFVRYGEVISLGGVRVSLHPAGHMLGSAQVRLEHRGRVAVVTGDYKWEPDATCTTYEPQRCDLLVTESTFGLPIYQWRDQAEIFAEINAWWRSNRDAGKASVLYGYAVGKSQRLISGLDTSIGEIWTHGAVQKGVDAYRHAGVDLPPTRYVGDAPAKHAWEGAMIVAVPSAHGTPWIRKFGPVSTGMASGWMAVRGSRRRRAMDRGFVMSDHIDWPGLLAAVRYSEAEEVWVTHGYTAAASRYLQSIGVDAKPLKTHFGEEDAAEPPE